MSKRHFHDIIHTSAKLQEVKHLIDLNKIIICTDFDHTLTSKYCSETGIEIFTTFSIVENSSQISENFKIENKRLYEKYYKYEVDHTLSAEFKRSISREWFEENKKCLLKEHLTNKSFEIIAKEAGRKIKFRPELKHFLDFLNRKNIPLYVISAGLQDSIDALMERDFKEEVNNLKSKNLYTSIGNKLIFDINGIHTGFGEDVYSYNKGDIMKNKIKLEHKDRNQYLMLGDHLWDINALDSFDGTKFTIGYGNFNGKDLFKSSFNQFINTYDVTIVNDGTFNTVIKFLNNKI